MSLGAAKPSDFDEHLKVPDVLDRVEAVVSPIARRLNEVMVERLGADWVENFREGLPGPEQTPGNLNIPILLWMRNLVLAYDMVGYAKMRYGLFNEGGHWFPGDKIESLEALRAMDLSGCLAASPFAERIGGCLEEFYELVADGIGDSK